MLSKNLVFVSVLVLLLALSGCQLFIKPTLDRIVLSADAQTVNQGESVNLEVKGFDKNNKEMKVSKPSWSAEPEDLGELDVNGAKAVFTAGETAEGTVTITVTSGDLSDSIEITIIKETPSTDKEDLENAIQISTQLKQSTPVGTEPGQAPQEAHDALQAAIDAAQAVFDDENATQAEVDSATQALLQAKAAFEAAIVPEEPGQVDKAALTAAIDEAEDFLDNTGRGIYKDQAPVHAHAALQAAVDEAIIVRDDENATQAEVDAAKTTLEEEIAAFIAQIVTDDDPIAKFDFTSTVLKDRFTTDDNKGKVEFNLDERFIKIGTDSFKFTVVKNPPSPFRIRLEKVSADVWPKDWRPYDHFAVWVYISDTNKLQTDPIGFAYPMGSQRFVVQSLQNGWNEIVVDLREDLELTDEELTNMGLFELLFRAEDDFVLYIDAIRLLQLEEHIVDKSILEATIFSALTLKDSTPVGTETGQAPQLAHDAFLQAIGAAQAVLDDNNATQAQVDTAVDALEQAITAFEDAIIGEQVDSDKTELIAAINEAEDLLADTEQGIYFGQAPVHAHGALQAAVDAAKTVRDDISATQEEVDDTTADLQQAIDDFNNEIITDPDPIKYHTYRNVPAHDTKTISAEKGSFEANYDPIYIKMGEFSIKFSASGSPFDLRIRAEHPDRITDWSDYDHFSVWVYIEDVDSLVEGTAFQWVYGTANDRITLPRSAFVEGWNEILLNLREDLGFSDAELANMTDIFCLRFRAQIPYTIYFDQIRLLKLEEDAPADKEDLENAIRISTDLMQATPVGTASGQAPHHAHSAFKEAIIAAQAVYDDPDATQAESDTATFELLEAKEAFEAAIIESDITILFRETFDLVPDGKNIRPSKDSERTETLDNPDSFLRGSISGTVTANGGVIALGTQRMAFIVPGLADAENPVLIVTLKNDDGTGNPVANMKLYVGDSYSSSGTVEVSGHRAHGEYEITSSSFFDLRVELAMSFTSTNMIQFRGTVDGAGTAGLYIDKIEVIDEE